MISGASNFIHLVGKWELGERERGHENECIRSYGNVVCKMGTKEEEARFPCLSFSLSWSLGVVVVGVLPAHHRCCGNYKKRDHGGHHHHQQHYCCQYWRSRTSLFRCAQTWLPSERIWATSIERERERERERDHSDRSCGCGGLAAEWASLSVSGGGGGGGGGDDDGARSFASAAVARPARFPCLFFVFPSSGLFLLSLFLLFYYACPCFLPSSSGSMRRHGNSGWCILRAFSGEGGEGIDRM